MRLFSSFCTYSCLLVLGVCASLALAAPRLYRGSGGEAGVSLHAGILPAQAKPDPPKPTAHTSQQVEGWTVVVDSRLLQGPDKDLGDRALRLLANRLYSITLIVPPDRLARLQKVSIRLDKTNGKLVSPQYHPSVEWLKENGYDPTLAKCVHIPDAAYFASPRMRYQQPFAVLHELAHSYHDQVLGFEDAEILAAWHHFVDSGRYKSVLHIDGHMRQHYALTDQKEFFAEMSESYLGFNDFYPFNAAELKRDEPELFTLLAKIWGPLP
ncbi:MAG: hypothetical protein JWN14_2271 [Chthonomonadales bacterium]|nr:hypothetical protein [Chthonomonadales bacterium]